MPSKEPDNLDLWHLVEKTDPAAVRPITGKAYKGNSPKPHWLVQRATEVFGPCGIGWGIEVKDSQYIPTEAGTLHSATVRVWYNWHGIRGDVEHVGGTPASGKRRSGEVFYDEDAAKKSVTDGMVKALSMMGFAADIFSGRWDDSKYQDEVAAHYAPPVERKKPDEPLANAASLAAIATQLNRTKRSPSRLLRHYGVETPSALTAAQADDALAILKAAPDASEPLGDA
jgi:hypothetical protein